MKITRRQLRKLISETIYGRKGYKMPPVDPMTRVPSGPMKDRLQGMIGSDDKEYRKQGYELARMLQEPDLVFPIDKSDPYEELAYQGDDYLDDSEKLKQYYHQIGVESKTDTINGLPTTVVAEIPLTHEIINMVVNSWNVWRKDKSKVVQFKKALENYYDSLYRKAKRLGYGRLVWWGEDGIHPELDQALYDGEYRI
jgi:hypothetical protein